MMGKYLGSADQKILWYFEYFLNKKYSLGPMCLPTTIIYIYTKNTLDYKYTI